MSCIGQKPRLDCEPVMLMTKGSIDRRVARTRATLHEALLCLMTKQSYEVITVGDICQRASVARSTFYAHYAGKDDLMRGAIERLRELLLERQTGDAANCGNVKARELAFSLTMLEHARGHAHLHRSLGNRGTTIVLDKIRQILCDLVRAEFATVEKGKDAPPREFVVQYIVGAYMAVMSWWLEGGATLAPEQVDVMLRRLATEGLTRSYGYCRAPPQ